jgi:predicted membrane metal-binding protein
MLYSLFSTLSVCNVASMLQVIFCFIYKFGCFKLMMYFLPPFSLKACGSSTVHIYVKLVHSTTQSKQKIHRTTQSKQTIHRTTQSTQTIHRTTQSTQTVHRKTQLTNWEMQLKYLIFLGGLKFDV